MSHTKINTDQCLDTGGHNMELVNSFVHLGFCFMDGNNELSEIQRRLILANSLLFRYHINEKFIKIRLQKTLTHAVLTYGCGTWKLRKTEDLLKSFERKIFKPNSWTDNRKWEVEDQT